MPLVHCSKCQHEYETVDLRDCDWCSAPVGQILEEQTSFELYIASISGGLG